MTNRPNSNVMHIALWIVQSLLALAFGMAGFMKLLAPINQLAEMGMTFVTEYKETTVRFIGICELLGAIGLILPSALRIKPILTPLAALGIVVIMILAIFQHLSKGEPIVSNIVMIALSAFVAWGRFKLSPIQAR